MLSDGKTKSTSADACDLTRAALARGVMVARMYLANQALWTGSPIKLGTVNGTNSGVPQSSS